MTGVIAIIGDIHGCIEPLEEIISIATSQSDRLVFVGDYINRGDQSAEVLDRLIRLKAESSDAVFLRGNHETEFVRYLQGEGPAPFLALGGAKTLASYGTGAGQSTKTSYRSLVPTSHRSFLLSLSTEYRAEGLLVTHGPRFYANPPADEYHVYGHVPQATSRPTITETSAAIDTGCGTWPGAPLTCFLWPRKEWFQSGGQVRKARSMPVQGPQTEAEAQDY